MRSLTVIKRRPWLTSRVLSVRYCSGCVSFAKQCPSLKEQQAFVEDAATHMSHFSMQNQSEKRDICSIPEQPFRFGGQMQKNEDSSTTTMDEWKQCHYYSSSMMTDQSDPIIQNSKLVVFPSSTHPSYIRHGGNENNLRLQGLNSFSIENSRKSAMIAVFHEITKRWDVCSIDRDAQSAHGWKCSFAFRPKTLAGQTHSPATEGWIPLNITGSRINCSGNEFLFLPNFNNTEHSEIKPAVTIGYRLKQAIPADGDPDDSHYEMDSERFFETHNPSDVWLITPMDLRYERGQRLMLDGQRSESLKFSNIDEILDKLDEIYSELKTFYET